MITEQYIKSAFRDVDIEGLIENGAPDNEYDSEAETALKAISGLKERDLTEDNIVSIISLIWAKSFNRDEGEMKLRLPDIHRLARKLLQA